MKRRGSASILGCPIIAWLAKLRENEPITVPSRGARLCDEIRGDDARRLRHVLHDDGGLSGNVPLQMLGEEARADVVVAADRMAADQTDLLALVEILHALPAGPRRHAHNQAECRQPVTRFRIHVVFPIAMPRTGAA